MSFSEISLCAVILPESIVVFFGSSHIVLSLNAMYYERIGPYANGLLSLNFN